MSELQSEPSGAQVLVVAGPTGVGKTAVAVALCQRFDGELVGADSVQVYRGLDIGSAKPTPAELFAVPHHLIDVVDPDASMDAARFARMADAAIADIQRRGRVPVVVGGTGLWLRALLRGLVELPPVDPQLRNRLEREWEQRGATAMHARLRAVDPQAAARIHENDRLRVVRALEVYTQTGAPLGALRGAHALGRPRYRSLMWALDVPRPHYDERIAARVDEMWQAGWLTEVERLIARYGAGARGLSAVGYKQVVAHLSQAPDLRDEARTRADITRATLAYAKRQRTWFRGDPGVDRWLTPADATAPAQLEALEGFLSGRALRV